jgi:hypothetical protein
VTTLAPFALHHPTSRGDFKSSETRKSSLMAFRGQAHEVGDGLEARRDLSHPPAV